MLRTTLTYTSQIRIVVDTHQDEKPNKKKKKHRGYAFVVYEREKDMRGKPANGSPCPPIPGGLLYKSSQILYEVMALKLAYFISFCRFALPLKVVF
jgi:hypothetical protein